MDTDFIPSIINSELKTQAKNLICSSRLLKSIESFNRDESKYHLRRISPRFIMLTNSFSWHVSISTIGHCPDVWWKRVWEGLTLTPFGRFNYRVPFIFVTCQVISNCLSLMTRFNLIPKQGAKMIVLNWILELKFCQQILGNHQYL